MIEFISQPWPWYTTGVMIVLTLALLTLAGRPFGVSGTLRTMCSAAGLGRKISFFRYNWKDDWWNLVFVVGLFLGGFIAQTYLANPHPMDISEETLTQLQAMEVSTDTSLLAPANLFSWESLMSMKGILLIVLGGFFVGFGARYAGGCTSGHAITGLSNLQLPSLIAVVGFFIGGLLMTHFFLPIILGL